jgi:MFS family permease
MIAAQIFVHSSVTGLRIAGPLAVLAAGGGPWHVGLLLALFGLGPLFVALPAGRMVDRHGYRRPFRAVIVLAAVAALVAVGSSFAGPWQFMLLCIAAPLGGAAANSGMIILQRTAARLAPDAARIRSVFAWTGLAPSISNIVGPLVAGVALDLGGARGAFVALLLLPVIGWALSRLVATTPPPARDPGVIEGSLMDLLRIPLVRRMFFIDFLMIASWDIHAYIVPTLGHERGLTGTEIGIVAGLFAAGVVTVRASIPWLSHRLREGRVLMTAMLLTAAVFAVYPASDSAAFMGVCAYVLGAAVGVSQPMVLSSLHQAVQDSLRAKVLALRSISTNAAALSLPLAFAFASSTFGWVPLLWLAALSVGAGSHVTRRLGR